VEQTLHVFVASCHRVADTYVQVCPSLCMCVLWCVRVQFSLLLFCILRVAIVVVFFLLVILVHFTPVCYVSGQMDLRLLYRFD